MSKKEALYQSFASCGAALIAFIGVCHEFIGYIVFPWGPTLLGGPIGWHSLGIFAIVAGLLILGGTLHLIKFPVVPFAVIVVVIGVVLVVFTAIVHHQFHMFALAAAVAGAVTAFFHRKTVAQQVAQPDASSAGSG
jgi:hypothetical protein